MSTAIGAATTTASHAQAPKRVRDDVSPGDDYGSGTSPGDDYGSPDAQAKHDLAAAFATKTHATSSTSFAGQVIRSNIRQFQSSLGVDQLTASILTDAYATSPTGIEKADIRSTFRTMERTTHDDVAAALLTTAWATSPRDFTGATIRSNFHTFSSTNDARTAAELTLAYASSPSNVSRSDIATRHANFQYESDVDAFPAALLTEAWARSADVSLSAANVNRAFDRFAALTNADDDAVAELANAWAQSPDSYTTAAVATTFASMQRNLEPDTQRPNLTTMPLGLRRAF